ncbi:MAG: DUF3616 domain-containing protein [Gemmatirosa sp.]
MRSSAASTPRQVTLDFTGVAGAAERRDLSAVTAVGDHLWLGTDEGTQLVRLTRVAADRWADAVTVPLDSLLTLPGGPDDEVDVEGLDASDGWLWVVGSHSVRRGKPDEAAAPEERLDQLADTTRKGNRHLLARLPLVPDGSVVRETVDAEGATRCAARLRGGRARDALTRALRDDRHLAPFLDIPGKDNGFDVEGLAVDGARCWLGLRGPVLRGLAVVLAIEVRPGRAVDDALRLRRCGPDGRRYEKFFLDLSGLGVRELCLHGDDLLILAGPTMQLDGRAVVLRWRGARHARGDTIVDRAALEIVAELPYGRGDDEGVEHPEGIAVLGDARPALLVVHDAPSARRVRGDALIADAYPLD